MKTILSLIIALFTFSAAAQGVKYVGNFTGNGNGLTNLNPAASVTNTPTAGDLIAYTSATKAKATTAITQLTVTNFVVTNPWNAVKATNVPITALWGSGGTNTAATNGTAGQVLNSAANGGVYWATASGTHDDNTGTNFINYGDARRTNWTYMTIDGLVMTNSGYANSAELDAFSSSLAGIRVPSGSAFAVYQGTTLNSYDNGNFNKPVGGIRINGQGQYSGLSLNAGFSAMELNGNNSGFTFELLAGGAGIEVRSSGTFNGTNGYALFQRQTIPTNSIPSSSSGVTNFVLVNLTNNIGSAISGGLYFVATNTASSGSFLLRKITVTEAAWP